VATPRQTDLVLTAVGGVSPVGTTIAQTCASVCAGIQRFSEHAYYSCLTEDPEWDEPDPLLCASAGFLDPFVDGPERLVRLFLPALTELIAVSKLRRTEIAAGAFYLALPALDRATASWSLEATLVPELFGRAGLDGFRLTGVDQSGSTGMLRLIAEAERAILSGQVEYCIVGGVDSYLLEERLVCFDENRRLRSLMTVDGFVPGEAAVALLLETSEHARSRKREPFLTMDQIVMAREPNTIESDKQSTGTGLAEAVTGALALTGVSKKPGWVLCDLNGESYRAFEWGLVTVRVGEALSDVRQVSHPADCMGDVGACSGGVLIALAAHAFQRGLQKSEEALVWASSDCGERAALTVRRPKD
jgi:3-oxoacyl-[acyl-carrier-protein] synthase-1